MGLRHLVTGGAGFVGSHLIDRLMAKGEEVICLDNYFTGRKDNIRHWIGHPNFELIRHDVTNFAHYGKSHEVFASSRHCGAYTAKDCSQGNA